MKARFLLVSFSVTLLGSGLAAHAGELTAVLSFSQDDLLFSKVGSYHLVSLGDHPLTGELREPLLPSANCSVVLPPTAELKCVEILTSHAVELSGEYIIHPAQEPVPISSKAEPAFLQPDPATYSSSAPYPADIVELCRTGSMGQYRIGAFLLHPLQYIPSERRLKLHTTIELRIVYREGVVSPRAKTRRQREVFGERARKMVLNPEDVEEWEPPLRDSKQGTTEYAIVTTDAYVSSLQPFADWKTKKGIPTEIKTISWIDSVYGGHYDTPENIREFLKDYCANDGLIWVLLAGDTPVVPHRIAKVVTTQVTGYIPCDLYFSDLDGTWDANGNHVYGEPGDNVDMYSDVYVGRASIDNTTEAATFWNKVFTFERNPPPDYLRRICLPALLLLPPNYHGDVVNNAISNCTPSGWEDVKLYQSLGNVSNQILKDSLNSGFQFCHGASHGDTDGWHYYGGAPLLSSADAYGLANGSKLTIVNSIACLSGAFDQGDCQAENFVLNPHGGAVASIQNSRYGWGNPPSMGPSEELDLKFYSKFFSEDMFQIGETHAASKDYFVGQAQGDPHWRWCVYELNLFGDPNMPMWTEVPESMTVNHPQSVPPGPRDFSVAVTHEGTPIEDALVCVRNSTVYEHGYTNSSGEIILSIDPLGDDTLQVTATAYNHYPYEGECLVGVGVEENVTNNQSSMTNFQLFQNFPNPFSHSTAIPYRLSGGAGEQGSRGGLSTYQHINLSIYDLAGRLVKVLFDDLLPTCPVECVSYSAGTPYLSRAKSGGSLLPTPAVWDGDDCFGRQVAGGMYFYTISVGQLQATKSMVLLR